MNKNTKDPLSEIIQAEIAEKVITDFKNEIKETKEKASNFELHIIIRVIFRIIGFPFIFILLAIPFIRMWFTYCYLYLRYGGEFVSYSQKFNPQTITTALNDALNIEK